MIYEMRPLGVLGAEHVLGAYAPDGGYIGTEEWAQILEARGIVPQLRPGSVPGNSCSIGFCDREQKWYGWSHRAMHGFAVGDSVAKGDCAYSPTDPEDFRLDVLRFWGEGVAAEWHEWTRAEHGADDEGNEGVQVTWKYNVTTPNASLRGTEGGVFSRYPETYGRGEWTAETLDDAKQMACDFAEGVD